MSFDVFVLDLPRDARSVDDVPADFVPGAIGSLATIRDAIRSVLPTVRFDDLGWATVEGYGYSIEINIGNRDPVESFAFHVRGDAPDALFLIAEILGALNLRALAPGTESGFFSVGHDAVAAFTRWRSYRDHVTRAGPWKGDTRFDEIWVTAPDGSSLCALINGDHGFLMHLREPGDPGATSRNPLYAGPPATTLEYRLNNGQVDEFPAAWALPIAEVRRAVDYFEREGKRPPFITWHDD